jgi:hypothetical protein
VRRAIKAVALFFLFPFMFLAPRLTMHVLRQIDQRLSA